MPIDTSTIILFVLTFFAYCWWVIIQLDDNKKSVKELEMKEKDRLARAERVKQLTNSR